MKLQSGQVWETAFLAWEAGFIVGFFQAVPIRDANGAVIRWFGTNTDTTDLKKRKKN
jgi:hypothetical protein